MQPTSSISVLVALAALAAAGLACQTVTRITEGGQELQPTSLFFDDFSDSSSGWDRQQYDGGRTDYLDGQYQIMVTEPDSDYWANPGLDFANIRIETVATKAGGPDDNDFGVICRYQDLGNFYYFVISSDGYAGILKVKDQETTPLGSGRMEPAAAVRQGKATNAVAAECIGPRLRLYVNDQLVAEVQDSDFASGDVGLIAGTFSTPGADIRFDDFNLLVP